MKAKKFEQQFDEDVDITASLELSKAKRVLQEQRRVTVPGTPSDDLAPGTLNSILKQAGLK
jgi:hypothetical protein